MTLFEFIGLVAGVIQAIGYIWYNVLAYKKIITPNAGSWFIWSYGNAIICWQYILSGQHLTFKESLPVVCSILCVLTAVFLVLLKRFAKISLQEIVILIADIAITMYWLLMKENVITQILLQTSVFISFISIFKETRANPKLEQKGPWIIWSIAYCLLFIAEYNEGWVKWIFPIHYLVWHIIMAYVSSSSKSSTKN